MSFDDEPEENPEDNPHQKPADIFEPAIFVARFGCGLLLGFLLSFLIAVTFATDEMYFFLILLGLPVVCAFLSWIMGDAFWDAIARSKLLWWFWW